MKTFSKTMLAVATIGLVGVIFSGQTHAAPIQGSIDFGGVVTFNTMSLATATRVNVWNSSFVLQDSGDFSSISPGTSVTMAAPWIFNPSTATPNLWSVAGFKFDLTSSVIVTQNSTFLNITGVGTMSGNGFDTTPGTWSFTSSDSNGSNQASFGFQAQSTQVPEASTVALLGIGALGLTVAQSLRRNLRPRKNATESRNAVAARINWRPVVCSLHKGKLQSRPSLTN